ncbi:GNAT family N-acetyltransferase [Cohnella sp. GCM10027633]|uniref:GNAT family N-acetyltransferase n=1 Tax=unclassified Cohnella TaxID=2636738 RepID=UPI0036417ECD
MIFSQADISDLPRILALQYEAYQSEADIYQSSIPPLEQTLSQLEEEYNEGTIIKVINNDEIIGSVRATIRDGICLIGKLIVKPEYQNQRIGKKLMKEIEESYRHAKRMELFTGHKSIKNIELYKKLGYRIFKEIHVNDSLTLIYMYKET